MVSTNLRARSLPLTFRLMAVMTVASFFVALLVAFLGSERGFQERVVAQRTDVASFAESFAARLAQALENDDMLRVALLATSASDATGHRVLVLDRQGTVRVDTGLALGDQRLGLLAHAGAFQRPADLPRGFETLAPVRQRGELVGEVRLQELPTHWAAAPFSWGLFGISFLSCLSLVAVASMMTHHWFARVRAATQALLSLAAGEVGSSSRPEPAVGELQEFQDAMAELDRGMNEGLSRVAEGFVGMATQMVDALERRGLAPPGHGERTSRYSALLAGRLGLLDDDKRDLELAARLHDLGKMWVRPSLLSVEGQLDEVERQSLRQHPVRAADALEYLPNLRRAAQMIRHHHEKYDGTGYPDGLRGDRIPLGGRILAIADGYDQLTSCKVEGETLTWPDALDRLRADRGEHFDPWLLDLFEEEIRQHPIPERPDLPVTISTAGVVPYKLGQARIRNADDEDWDGISEDEFELMLDDVPEEEGS